MDKKRLIKRITGMLLAAFVLALTVYMCFSMYKLRNGDNLAEFEDKIRTFGAWGVVIMLLIQILQVVLAVIPGEPIELAMGALYGTWGGCALCLIGIVVGTAVVFLCVKRFGRRFVDNFISGDKFARLKFLREPSKRDVLLFILMFIPGTPKDTLTYFGPFTGITFVRFLVISTLARIPSVVSSSYIGASLMDGDYMKSVIAFAVVGAVSLIGIIVYNKILASKNKDR